MQIFKLAVFYNIIGFAVSDNLTQIVSVADGRLVVPDTHQIHVPEFVTEVAEIENTTRKDPVLLEEPPGELEVSITVVAPASETTSKHGITTLITSVTVTITEKALPTQTLKRQGQKSGASAKNILKNSPPPNVIAISPQFVNHGVSDEQHIPAAVYAKPRISWDQIKPESQLANKILEQDGYIYEFIYEEEEPEISKTETEEYQNLYDAFPVTTQGLRLSNYSTISLAHPPQSTGRSTEKKYKTPNIGMRLATNTNTTTKTSANGSATSTSTIINKVTNHQHQNSSVSRSFPSFNVSFSNHRSTPRTGETNYQHQRNNSKIKSLLHWFHFSSGTSRFYINIHVLLVSLAVLMLFL